MVYQAQDLRLDRLVAIKFLPPHLTACDESRQRFFQEAKVASALDHPNVCTIFEIDELEDHQVFIAMAYYRGATLDRMMKQGRLSLEQILAVAGQVSRGLEAAHQANLMHRDIKPANIMVTEEGLVKILDFGLARLVGEAELTREGTVLGTVAYMSPEQARGLPVDQRTDLWSLGVVLFELLTGQRPFKGEDWRSTIYAITTHQAPRVEHLRADVPAELAAIVQRALAKRLADRYQHAAPLIADLERLREETSSWGSRRVTVTLDAAAPPSSTGSFIKEPSILVLPFADLSPDKDNEYFSDGLTDEIITDLSQIGGLRVISRTSAMLLKGAQKDVRTIGNELGVGHVLEGNVRKAGNNLRITAQLIDAVNDQLLWTNRFKGTLEDIFEIQEEVARAVVEALKVQLTPQEQDKIKQRPIDNPHAYECYLQARQEITLWTEDASARFAALEQRLEDRGRERAVVCGSGLHALGLCQRRDQTRGARRAGRDLHAESV